MMYFDSFSEFIAMGGHGFYVWLAYGVTGFALITWLAMQAKRRRTVLAQLPQRIARSEAQ